MSTEVALRASEVPASFDQQMHMATVLAESSLLPAHLRGKPANVLVVLQGARALDISAFWAFQSMHVVDGKLGLAAELMRAMVIKAGHQFTVIERTAHRAVVEIKRKDKERPYRAEFTADDAKTAGLTGKDNWKKYFKSMLVARATSIGVRDECPEVLFGMVYTPDELGAETDRDGAPIITQDGAQVVQGQVVQPPTSKQLLQWASLLEDAPLPAIPGIWVEIRDRAAVFATPGDGDDSLYDLLVNRIIVAVKAARCRPEVRELFDLCKLLQLGDARHPDGRWLRDFMVDVGNGLPEECPSGDVEDPTAPPGGEGEGDASPEPQEGSQGVEAETIDTPTAEALRRAAAESWGEDDETAQAAGAPVASRARRSEREQEATPPYGAALRERMVREYGGTPTEGEADVERSSDPEAPLVGEIVDWPQR